MGWPLGALVGLVACTTPAVVATAGEGTPEATYRTFAEALRGREPKVAWELLSRATKDAAQVRAEAVATASGGVVKAEPMVMVLQSGVLPGPIGEISVIEKTDRTAVLEVGPPQRRSRVQLVHELAGGSSAWRVDLASAFSAGGR